MCITNSLGIEDNKEANERLENLKRGHKFMRTILLGMGAREVYVNLSEDTATLHWKATKTTLMNEEIGQIDMTLIKTIKISGSSTLQFISSEGDKCIFDINCDDTLMRDRWVIALNELIQDWNLHPDKKPKSSLTAGMCPYYFINDVVYN